MTNASMCQKYPAEMPPQYFRASPKKVWIGSNKPMLRILRCTKNTVLKGISSTQERKLLCRRQVINHESQSNIVTIRVRNIVLRTQNNAGKYCWYANDSFPYGNWVGDGGHGYI